MDIKDLENRFNYHKPKKAETTDSHELVRRQCFYLAEVLYQVIPDGREKSLAITKLEEVMMWANAGIARND